MGVAVGIALIYSVQAQIHAFEVYKPPSWIFPLLVWSHSILMSPIGKLDPENIGIAVGISLISRLGPEIHAFEVWRPPSWIFPLPVRSHSILMSPNVKLDPENIGIAVEFSLISCLGTEIHAFEVWRPPSCIFPLSVWSHSILMSPNGKLDPENIGIAVRISLISRLGAEIHALEVKRPPSWIFPLPVLSHSIRLSPSGMLDLKNVGIAVGISVISCWSPCLEAEIHAIEVFRPPSCIFPLPVKSHSIPIYSTGKLDTKSK